MSVERAGGPMRRRRGGGFTLIELMVTIALVALVAAVAYPTYVASVQKARRADARVALTEAAQRLERYSTDNNTYVGALLCNLGDARCTAATQVYPINSENGYYALGYASGPTVSTFTIQALPQGGQATDACGTFMLDQSGVRTAGNGSEADRRKCW